jgi:hypothetical protein
MAHNLRKRVVEDELYVNVNDLFKVMVEVMTLDSLHPAAIQAIDGLGVGLGIILGVVKIEDLPENSKALVERLTSDK